MQNNILSIIRGEIQDFLYNDIEIVPGYTFNHYNTVKRSHLYINSQFEDQSYYQGRPKMFDNKIKPKRDRIAAFLNIDTKDIKLISRSGSTDPFKTLLGQKELDYYLKDNDFAQKFNDMVDVAVDYGSVVLKKSKNKAEIVDLRRFFCDPTVENLQESRFITFKYLFTVSQLRKKVKDGWDAQVIEAIIEKKERELNSSSAGTSYEEDGQINVIRSTPLIEVYERYGEVEQTYLNDNGTVDKTLAKSMFIVAEPMSFGTVVDDLAGNNHVEEYGGVLFKGKWMKDYPVDEFHYHKIRGRWLGLGVTESLYIPQERFNELINQKRVSMELSTIQLYWSPDKTAVRNVLTDLVNGDLITSANGINQIANEPRNLAAFQSEEVYYQASIDALSGISQTTQGEPLPSSTPATNAVIQNNNASSVPKLKRQNYANFLRRFLRTQVLDDLLSKMSEDHILRFVGDYEEMTRLTLSVAISYANAEVKEKTLKGIVVDQQRFSQMIAENIKALKSKNELQVQIKKAWYDDIDLDFDILIDNEQQATDVIAQNTWQIIQALSANPEALQNPVIRTLIFDYAEKVGINPSKLESLNISPTQQQGQPQQPQSVPAANPQQSPIGQGQGQQVMVGNRK